MRGVLAGCLLSCGSALLGAAQTPAAPSACAPIAGLRFVCGPEGPEDLVAVPRTPWLVSSAMAGAGGLYVVDTSKGTSTKVFPTGSSAERLDATTYGSCPGPLRGSDRTAFVTHGLYLKAGPRASHTLYAVHHGGRESIEVFTLDAAAAPPVVTWVGCVVAPDPIGLNAVVALPDGGFAATNFDPRPPSGVASSGVSAKVLSGDRNGEVWEWHPTSGWVKVPGSEASGANGLELSADGKWYYVAQWGNRAFMRLSRGKTPVERQEISVGFRVDNLRWSRDGKTLLAAGQDQALSELSQGRGPVSVIGRIDPRTMKYHELIRQPVPAGLFAATVALEAGGQYWVGSFRGDRITRYPIPAGK
jgi:sugar lactone lactonase YvrE